MQNKILKLGATGTVLVAAAAIGAVYLVSNMRTVPAGYVGVRVNLYADKGVDNEVVGTGRYFLGFNEQLFKFPTFNQLISYEEPFTFQTSDAMDVRARVGVEYNITPEKAATIFQTYRKGIRAPCGIRALARRHGKRCRRLLSRRGHCGDALFMRLCS